LGGRGTTYAYPRTHTHTQNTPKHARTHALADLPAVVASAAAGKACLARDHRDATTRSMRLAGGDLRVCACFGVLGGGAPPRDTRHFALFPFPSESRRARTPTHPSLHK
jgi:hypothetical protein